MRRLTIVSSLSRPIASASRESTSSWTLLSTKRLNSSGVGGRRHCDYCDSKYRFNWRKSSSVSIICLDDSTATTPRLKYACTTNSAPPSNREKKRPAPRRSREPRLRLICYRDFIHGAVSGRGTENGRFRFHATDAFALSLDRARTRRMTRIAWAATPGHSSNPTPSPRTPM
jgi:hypothetical protein